MFTASNKNHITILDMEEIIDVRGITECLKILHYVDAASAGCLTARPPELTRCGPCLLACSSGSIPRLSLVWHSLCGGVLLRRVSVSENDFVKFRSRGVDL